MERKDTIQELRDLQSSLPDFPANNVYTVPNGYFEEFAAVLLNRIHAINAANPAEELNYLAPVLNSIPKENMYAVPEGYFSQLPESMLTVIHEHEDYQTANEELSALSPLLSSIGKKNPYSIPEGYFENLSKDISMKPADKPQAKTVSMVNRKWYRFAAAAVVIGFVALTGISLFFNNGAVSVSNTHAWVEENMKKVSTDDINSFIQPGDEKSIATASSPKTADIKELMKDVSDNDIQNFLNETNTTAEDSSDDLLLN